VITLLSELAYEVTPTEDEQILAIDQALLEED
jgi:hypothetical protein